jgi:hypothetical protein
MEQKIKRGQKPISYFRKEMERLEKRIQKVHNENFSIKTRQQKYHSVICPARTDEYKFSEILSASSSLSRGLWLGTLKYPKSDSGSCSDCGEAGCHFHNPLM